MPLRLALGYSCWGYVRCLEEVSFPNFLYFRVGKGGNCSGDAPEQLTVIE